MRRYTYSLFKKPEDSENKEEELCFEHNANMGQIISKLIPCLKPDLEDNKRTKKLMSQRYTLKDEKMEYLLGLDLYDDLNEFTEGFPIFCDFVPNNSILR